MSGQVSRKSGFVVLYIVTMPVLVQVLAHFTPTAIRTLPVWRHAAEKVMLAIGLALAVLIAGAGLMAWRREKERQRG